jgi:pimeloyl-ACP methyl ester carboxylesterase
MRRRTALLGAGALGLGLGVAGAAVTGRASVRRHRARPDPEAEVPLGLLPPEDLGPVGSFDGTELAVRAAGPESAPALLFAHGITQDLTTWHYQWRAFSGRYRCILFDHRAHGRSGRPPTGDYSLRAIGHDLRAVMDRAAPDGPVVLIGHSMGGMAIVSLADLHPEEFGGRVAGVVLVDTAVSDVVKEAMGVLGVRLERLSRAFADRYLNHPERVEWVRRNVRRHGTDLGFLIGRATNFGPDASAAQIDHVTRISSDAPIEVWTHMLRSLIDMDLRHALGHITVPSLVVVGDRDTLTPKTSAVAIRRALPDARAYVLTRAGHLAMMERHRVFNELLEEHLDRVFARERAAG